MCKLREREEGERRRRLAERLLAAWELVCRAEEDTEVVATLFEAYHALARAGVQFSPAFEVELAQIRRAVRSRESDDFLD